MHRMVAPGQDRPDSRPSMGRTVGITRLRSHEGMSAFAEDVRRGLSGSPKCLPSMYFYDARGSDLFRRIMELPEYYLTSVEREILERNSRRIALCVGPIACDVVDLGAGNGEKTALVLDALSRVGASVGYVPVDISERALAEALGTCATEFPGLPANGIAAEYGQAVRWLVESDSERRRLVLLLGSNIGNLPDPVALGFLRDLRRALVPGDHVLVGFDLMKDVRLLQSAYDDGQGVTAEFNLNLLRRINRELGGTFDPSQFAHVATFSARERAMNSYLMSTVAQTVEVGGEQFAFGAWEAIQTEMSRKYLRSEVARFADQAGFVRVCELVDDREWFLDALWRVDDRGLA